MSEYCELLPCTPDAVVAAQLTEFLEKHPNVNLNAQIVTNEGRRVCPVFFRDYSYNPLIAVVIALHLPKCLYILIRHGLSLKVRTFETNSVFVFAAYRNASIEIFDILLSAGVNIDSIDLHGNTALHVAIAHYNIDTCRYLIARGINTEVVNVKGLKAIDLCHDEKRRALIFEAGSATKAARPQQSY